MLLLKLHLPAVVALESMQMGQLGVLRRVLMDHLDASEEASCLLDWESMHGILRSGYGLSHASGGHQVGRQLIPLHHRHAIRSWRTG